VVNSRNETSFFAIGAATGDIITTNRIDLRRPDPLPLDSYNEIKDPEGMAWDPGNRLLYVCTRLRGHEY
jgi:hypothetical protein